MHFLRALTENLEILNSEPNICSWSVSKPALCSMGGEYHALSESPLLSSSNFQPLLGLCASTEPHATDSLAELEQVLLCSCC